MRRVFFHEGLMSHMATAAELAWQAGLMESYGDNCVYVTDSGDRLTLDGVRDRVHADRDVLDRPPSSASALTTNLALGVANTVVAVEHGVIRVDASLAGQGAGAGNYPLKEASVGVPTWDSL